MENCNYWWTMDDEQCCDLTSESCSCGGCESKCSANGKVIEMAKREEQKTTLAEMALREKKRRMQQAS